MTQEELNEILEQHKLWLYTKGEEGKKADLSFDDLRDADLRGSDLRDADLRGTELRGANLRGANLSGADLRYSDLTNVDLRGADLKGADLKGANLTDVDLREADLTDTGVYFFKGPKDNGIYNSKDDKLYIGCQVHNLYYWLNNYVAIGREHKYSDEEIETYGQWIKSLKELK